MRAGVQMFCQPPLRRAAQHQAHQQFRNHSPGA